MPKTALVAYVFFMAVAFGWRSWIQYQRTGDVGFRGFSKTASAVERIAGVLFLAGALLGFVAPVSVLLGISDVAPALNRKSIHAVALLCVASGIAITVLAQLQMGDSWRVGVDRAERTALVRHGLFAHVRNPIFSGMLLTSFGLVLLVPTAISFVGWLALVVAIQLQVRWGEEPYLLSTHGEPYAQYARSAGRFVPGVGRLRA